MRLTSSREAAQAPARIANTSIHLKMRARFTPSPLCKSRVLALEFTWKQLLAPFAARYVQPSRPWCAMENYQTRFGSLKDYEKGGVQIIDDDPKNYVFSNIFEVCSWARPYERIAVGKNFEYVIEAMLANGVSPWYAANHDEFVLCLDGRVEVHLVKLVVPDAVIDPAVTGAQQLREAPAGPKMGRLILGRGHMGLLPRGAGYRFHADAPAALMVQTIEGPETVQKWNQICQTSS